MKFLKSKLTRRVLIVSFSLIVVVISISILNGSAKKVIGIVVPPLTNKFCDNRISQALICGKFVAWDKVALAAGGPYQTVSGNVDISGDVSTTGKVSIGTATQIGLLTLYNATTFDPAGIGLKQFVFGDVSKGPWRGTGVCTGGSTSGPNACFVSNLGSWYWGTQLADNTMKTTMSLTSGGTLTVNGQINGTTKNFEIDHPTKKGYRLTHSSLEGPEVGVFYKGEGKLVNGQVEVTLPDYFEALTSTEGRTVQLTAKGSEPFMLSASEVINGKFTTYGTKSDGQFYWEVKAVRKDVPPLIVEKPAEK